MTKQYLIVFFLQKPLGWLYCYLDMLVGLPCQLFGAIIHDKHPRDAICHKVSRHCAMCLSSCLDGCCQVCSIQMVMGRLDKDTVRLLPDQLWMKESTDLTLFVIAAWALEERNLTDSDGAVIMRIVLKRKLANELLTTFLPSVLLILITWATTFFKPFFFEAALSVNLTTMLVLTTIFMGVMQMLPSTAYIKMIDV